MARNASWWTPERQSYAVEYLKQNAGLSDIGARGLVSRWVNVEAPGGPGSVNRSSGAQGIGQWLGNRVGGFTLGDFESQLAHAAKELNGPEKQAGDALRAAATAAQAAIGASMFERAAGYNPSTGRDNFTATTQAGISRITTGAQGDVATAPIVGSAADATGVPIASGYVVPPETAASYFGEQPPAQQSVAFSGAGDTNQLAGSLLARDPLDVVQPPQDYVRPFGLDDPSAYHVGAGIMPQAQPLSPYVRGDFFGSPPVTSPISVHSTPQMSYAPASYAAIQPYSTQPSSAALAAAYGQRDASYQQAQGYGANPARGAAAASGLQGYTPYSASLSGYRPVAPSSLPIAPSDSSANEFSTGDIRNAQVPGQMPAATVPGGTPAGGGIAGFIHSFVQAAAPVVHQVMQTVQTGVMPDGRSLGGFLSGISRFGGGPLPSGVSDQPSFSSFLQHQNWEGPGTSHTGTAFSQGSGGSTYQYFKPSQPGGIGGYVVPAGHPNAGTVYTYKTSSGVQANP